jgi:SAM-dependent methyltransferase
VEYSHNQYGDVFADIYDDWYHDLDNITDVVEFVLQLADNSAVLELGVGTGRLAIPIAQAGAARGIQVVGIDSSQAMLDELRAKPNCALVETHLGHMVRDMPLGPFGVVLIAYNTLFNFAHRTRTTRVLATIRAMSDTRRAHHCRLFRAR